MIEFGQCRYWSFRTRLVTYFGSVGGRNSSINRPRGNSSLYDFFRNKLFRIRFPKKERVAYKMELIDHTIDTLINTIRYENKFKELIETRGLKKMFPVESFHGRDETFVCADGHLIFKESLVFEGKFHISFNAQQLVDVIFRRYSQRRYQKAERLEPFIATCQKTKTSS